MSTAPEYELRSTVDGYRQWEVRWELWNGFAVATTPSPFGRHAKALTDFTAGRSSDRRLCGSAPRDRARTVRNAG